MEATCPSCLARFPLAAALTDAAARQALVEALRCAAPAPLVLAYLECFRPPKRSLSWSRARRLLAELADAMAAGEVRRRGRSWTVTREVWTEALEVVNERRASGQLQTPLRDHAYLWEVVSGLANRAEAAEERRVETERQGRRGGGGGPRPIGDVALEGLEERRETADAASSEVAREALANMRRTLRRPATEAST